MTLWLELLLLAAALGVVAILGAGAVRARRGRLRGERLPELAGGGERTAESRHRLGFVDRRLRAAGITFPPWAVLVVLVGIAVAVGLAALAWLGIAIVAVAAALLAIALLWSLVGSRARTRALRFEERLVDAVGLMIAVLEAGENPRRALEGAADGSEEPVAGELRRAVDRLEAGADIREALAPIRRGYDSEGVRLFTQTLIAKWDTGGDLAPILKRIHRTMLERLSMRLRLQSELAGARLSAIIVALLPYLLIPFFAWRRPEWLRSVWEHPLGLQLLVGAIVLQIVGILWLRSLFRLETV